MRKLLVLGHNGCLARYLISDLKDKYQIIFHDAKILNTNDSIKGLRRILNTDVDLVLNTIGKKPKDGTSDGSFENLEIPFIISELKQKSTHAVHISSDAAKLFGAGVSEPLSSKYSRHKRIMEYVASAPNTTVVRTAFFVDEPNGLMRFLKIAHQNEATVEAYYNNVTNAVPVSVLSEALGNILECSLYGKLSLGTKDSFSKGQLVQDLMESGARYTITPNYSNNLDLSLKTSPCLIRFQCSYRSVLQYFSRFIINDT